MANTFFRFKQFEVQQSHCAMKVTTDGCLFGAWCATQIAQLQFSQLRVLDIGSGTGLLSLMIAQKNAAKIDAVEIDIDAARQAAENVAASPWAENISVLPVDVLNLATDLQYAVIISNPPFYENELEANHPKKNLAHHSTHLTLAALFATVKKLLAPGGYFFLLIPFKRLRTVEKLIKDNGLFVHQQVLVAPSVQQAPFRVMLQLAGCPNKKEHTSIAIKNEDAQYTSAFTSLLADYYLYL